MKKLVLLLLMLVGLLAGCGENKSSYIEIDREQVSGDVANFIRSADEYTDGTGIYKFYEKPNVQYLYINEPFLDDGKGFGGLDMTVDADTMHLDVLEEDAPTEATYRLYKIESNEEYEYSKVYKNGEETYFEMIYVHGE